MENGKLPWLANNMNVLREVKLLRYSRSQAKSPELNEVKFTVLQYYSIGQKTFEYEVNVFRITPSHWTLSVADISNDIDQLVESLNITESPRIRTFRSSSPLNDLRLNPNKLTSAIRSPSPHHTSPSRHLDSTHHTNLPHHTNPPSHTNPPHHNSSFPSIRTSPFLRASSPHLNVTERVSNFSKSCSDLIYNLDQTFRQDPEVGEDPPVDQKSEEATSSPKMETKTTTADSETDGRPGSRTSTRKSESDREDRPESRVSTRESESPVRELDRSLSPPRNTGTRIIRPWEKGEEKKHEENLSRMRFDRSPLRRSFSNRKRSSSMESSYDNYHSTKQSFIVRPSCITPINTTNLYYSNPGSRPITPLDTSELLYISSRSPSPEILFPPYRKPSPSSRRPATRSRGTSPLKVSFEEEPTTRDKEKDVSFSRRTPDIPSELSRSRHGSALDNSRSPSPLKNPLRTSSPKSLLDRSISPFDQMIYIPGKKGTPVSKEDLTLLSATLREASQSPGLEVGDQRIGGGSRGLEGDERREGKRSFEGDERRGSGKWSGYDSDGDGYRTANTSPEGGIPWW